MQYTTATVLAIGSLVSIIFGQDLAIPFEEETIDTHGTQTYSL